MQSGKVAAPLDAHYNVSLIENELFGSHNRTNKRKHQSVVESGYQ